MRQATWIILLLIGCHFAAMAQNQTATEGKYSYEYALNDPTKTRIYTLDNGLKVYLAINKDAPRIQTSIAVRTGSKNDPRDNTGLAHYLEHMLFKGTSRIATKDWDKEKALLQQISDLYEQHKATPDPAQKQRIYQQIDSLSLSASQYAIPNEYDKMISSLGAKGTNAYTSTDETVYINDIPSTGVEKWLMVESERFQELVLRLFHTELEAVYEEYNMGQDNVRRKMYQATLEALFPTHPYNVSTIGLGEHLKNPSMEAIHNYFSTYYVPNNIAICMAGDLDYAQTIAMIDKYFSSWKPKTVKKNVVPQEAPMHKALTKEVLTKDPEFLNIVYRFPTTPENELMLKLVDGILQNGQAGLIDLNLLQEQKVLDAATYIMEMSDYTL
ncbi:MAG TPA: pitrilysin family protein, partial [Chitinophagales bacterium]|nr:pitrilysin family protein [Chitinophagales bacterium]